MKLAFLVVAGLERTFPAVTLTVRGSKTDLRALARVLDPFETQ
jgi:hypothetical protein